MLDSIRKRQRFLLTITTVVVIVAFAWFYSPASRTRGGGPGGPVGKLNGRTITIDQIREVQKNFRLANSLGMTDMIRQLVTDGSTPDLQQFSYAWNLLLLRDAAVRLQVTPGSEQIKAAELVLPQFQTDGKFDAGKYEQFVGILKSNGYRATDIDDVVLDNLRFVGVSQLVKDASPAPESMFRKEFESGYRKMDLAIIRFKRADLESSMQVSDNEIKKYYDDHRAAFQSEEKRKISFVSFPLTDEQKKLPEEQQLAAKKALAEQSNAFAESILQNPGAFEETAKSKGFPVQQTGFFTKAVPDKLIAPETALAHQAFLLTKENPVSDVVEGLAGFYFLKLVATEASRQLSLEEAKDKVLATVKSEKVEAALQAKAKEVRDKISADLKNGIDIVKAAEAAGYKTESPEPFTLAEPSAANSELASVLRTNRGDLDPGQLSPFLTDSNGGFLAYKIKDEPIDEAKYEEFKKSNFPAFNTQWEAIAMHEWLKVELKKAGQSKLSS